MWWQAVTLAYQYEAHGTAVCCIAGHVGLIPRVLPSMCGMQSESVEQSHLFLKGRTPVLPRRPLYVSFDEPPLLLRPMKGYFVLLLELYRSSAILRVWSTVLIAMLLYRCASTSSVFLCF